MRGLQTLTIAELGVIAGGKLGSNHNETIVKFPNLSQKQKLSSEAQLVKVQELQTLTIADLEAIAGAGLACAEADA